MASGGSCSYCDRLRCCRVGNVCRGWRVHSQQTPCAELFFTVLKTTCSKIQPSAPEDGHNEAQNMLVMDY